jgi:hypothetical protein
MGRKRKRGKPSTQHRKAARLLAQGVSFKMALTEAGYSPAQARKGLAKIIRSPNFRTAVLREFRRVPLGLNAFLMRVRLRRKMGLPAPVIVPFASPADASEGISSSEGLR